MNPKRDSNAVKRLVQIAAQVRPTNQLSRYPHSFIWLYKLVLLQPACLTGVLRSFGNFTLVISNLPGPRDELNVFGRGKVKEIIAALGHTAIKNGAIQS